MNSLKHPYLCQASFGNLANLCSLFPPLKIYYQKPALWVGNLSFVDFLIIYSGGLVCGKDRDAHHLTLNLFSPLWVNHACPFHKGVPTGILTSLKRYISSGLTCLHW